MIGALLAASQGTGALGSLFPPATHSLSRLSNNIMPLALPDISTLAEITLRGWYTTEDYYQACRELGFDKVYATTFLRLSEQKLGIFDYITLWRRGVISDQFLELRATELKINPPELNWIKKRTEFFPSPADLIRFAVREVYTEETRKKYQMDDDWPKPFERESKKAGLPLDQAKNFWAAHWELPSILQGFEMLHRGVITGEELNVLLKTLDVMPYWREKLTQISYRPYSRVDVRRMYATGDLKRPDVLEAYTDIGYSPEKAQKMTDFTVKYENRETKGISRANIINAYKDDIITKDELIDFFKAFRYSEDIIEFWIAVADYEKTLEEIKLYVDDIVELYQMGSVTLDQVRTFLLSKDLPSAYIDRVISLVIERKAKRQKVPSMGDLEGWLKTGIIVEEYYVEKMRLIGYSDIDIQNYLTEIALGYDTDARKFLDIKIYLRWWQKEIISLETFKNTAIAMKYSEIDINNMLLEAQE